MRPSLSAAARTAPPRLAWLAVAAVLLLGSGCIYRMPIQQGNFLDAEQVDQLETGMTRSQVMFLLGTPMVPTAFDNSRWDYYYYLKVQRPKYTETRRLIVFFENDKVSRIDRTEMPNTKVTNLPTG